MCCFGQLRGCGVSLTAVLALHANGTANIAGMFAHLMHEIQLLFAKVPAADPPEQVRFSVSGRKRLLRAYRSLHIRVSGCNRPQWRKRFSLVALAAFFELVCG